MNELKLTDREWKGFLIGNLFDVKIGKSIDGNKVNREQGYYAYITRKEQNNGLDGFIDYDEAYLNTDYPVITIGNETAEPFVQNYPFFTGTKVNILKAKQTLSREVLSFIVSSLKQHKSKYSYSFTINSTRLRKQVVMLPVNGKNAPDWQFMEDFIKQKEQKQVDEITDYYANQALSLMINTGNLKGVQWKEFFISDIFTKIQRGKRLIKSNQTDGLKPYVSSTALNNGVDNFIGNTDGVRSFENCLTLANSGSVGSTFFQNYEFVASDHITALLLEKPNKYVYLFLSSVIKRLEEKYSFNREINDKRIQREKILLPVNSNNTPDWQFMADFMQKIEQDKIKTVLAYYNSTKNERGGVTRLDENVKWQTFKLSEICEILSGQDIYERERVLGETPYITATANNNGIGYFVDNSNKTLEQNCISINRNGSVGYAFYHPYSALYGNDTRKLRPKFQANKYISLFITMCLEKQRTKYGYGYKMGTARLKQQKILLPTADNSPDWQFMEN